MPVEPLLLKEVILCFETYSKPFCTKLMLTGDPLQMIERPDFFATE